MEPRSARAFPARTGGICSSISREGMALPSGFSGDKHPGGGRRRRRRMWLVCADSAPPPGPSMVTPTAGSDEFLLQ